MNPVYMPLKISEKFKNSFLKNTLKLGEFVSFTGYNVAFPNAAYMRSILWNKLSVQLGDFTVRGITPLPSSGEPVLPIIYPAWCRPRGTVITVSGRIYDQYMFSESSGRFLVAEEYKKVPVEKYLETEKTGIAGSELSHIMDSAFAETTQEVMMAYFTSTSNYLKRVGGTAVSLINTSSKHYASNFKELTDAMKLVNPVLKHEEITVYLTYEDSAPVKIRPNFKIRYAHMQGKKAKNFYMSRHTKMWEQSAVSENTIKQEEFIEIADIPFIPTREEATVQDTELLKEYSLDIGFYAFNQHLTHPEIYEEDVLKFKEKLINKLENNVPDIVEAMRLGIMMDIGDINGFGEHMARMMDTWFRLTGKWSIDPVLKTYTELFSRIEDIKGPRIKMEIASTEKKSRENRITNRVLWELNVLKPNGWRYEYFEQKMLERGMNHILKRFEELQNAGYIIEKRKGVYFAAASL